MNVLLLNPYRDPKRYVPPHLLPYAKFTPTDIGSYCLLPLDLAYLAGILRDKVNLTILDAHALALYPENIDFGTYDVVVLNTAPFSHWRCCQTFVGHVHECLTLVKKVGARTVVYGPHATVAPDDFSEADCVILGEPEAVIERALTGERSRLGPEKLNDLPAPDYSLFDFSLYQASHSAQIFENQNFGRIGVLAYSRGCPFKCGFCFQALVPRSVRNHPLQVVEQALRQLIEVHQCGCLFWEDLNFTLYKQHTLEICNLLKKYNVPYVIQTRVERIDQEIATALAESGCYKVEIGVESGVDSILQQFNKRITWQDVEHAVQVARQAGIPRGIAFAGLFAPGETMATIKETRRKFRELGLSFYCNIWFPYPNTSLYHQGVKEGIIGEIGADWNELLPLAGTIGTDFSTQQVRRICAAIARSERLHGLLKKSFNWRLYIEKRLMSIMEG